MTLTPEAVAALIAGNANLREAVEEWKRLHEVAAAENAALRAELRSTETETVAKLRGAVTRLMEEVASLKEKRAHHIIEAAALVRKNETHKTEREAWARRKATLEAERDALLAAAAEHDCTQDPDSLTEQLKVALAERDAARADAARVAGEVAETEVATRGACVMLLGCDPFKLDVKNAITEHDRKVRAVALEAVVLWLEGDYWANKDRTAATFYARQIRENFLARPAPEARIETAEKRATCDVCTYNLSPDGHCRSTECPRFDATPDVVEA